MSTKKKLIVGIAVLAAAILFSVFVVPRNRDIPVMEETTAAEGTTTMAESTTGEATTDWLGMDWTTEPYIETTAATTAATPSTTQRTTTKAAPPRTATTAPRPESTRPPSTTRAPVLTTKPPATTTRRQTTRTTTTRAPSTTAWPTTTTARPTTTTAADTLISYGINYGKSIGLTYRPQLTQGGEAVQSASQQAIRAKLDQAKAAGATQFNVWKQGSAAYIATGR
jgi:uncharacterized protein YpmB